MELGRSIPTHRTEDKSGTIEAAEFIGPLSRWAHDSKTAPRFIKQLGVGGWGEVLAGGEMFSFGGSEVFLSVEL